MAVTVTYEYPVAGITAPTANQVARINQVVASVVKTADGDASAVVTHSLALSAAQLAQGFPEVELEPVLGNFYTTQPFIAAKATNSVTITLGTGGGSGNASAQIRARVRRPTTATK